MAEEVNVLLFGHPASGKSSILGKVLESGGYLSEKQIEIYKNKSKDDDSQIEEKPDWYLNYVKAKKPKPTFARTFYETERQKFMFLEFQSDEDYLPKLMMKTKNATVGVLVLSGVYRGNLSLLEAIQTKKYIQLFRAICGSPDSVFHASSKLIVLINKNDARNFHCDGLKSKLSGYLKGYGFDISKVEIISVSSRSDENIHFFLSRLSALAAEENCCLRPELCGETRDKMDFIFKHMWENLISIDVHLDANSSDKSLWRERAEILYRAGKNLLDEKESLEASRIIKVACKAAEKAIRDVDDILLSLILSHGHHVNGNYQVAIKHYEKAKKLASEDKHLEGNILSYLLWGESRVDEAKKLVKQSQQVAKSRRKDQQKNEAEKSDAKEPEEAETTLVPDKPEDLEIPQKIIEISAKSSSTYLIDPEKRDALYSGSRMISNRSSKKAFIPVESSKLQDYEDIEDLGFQHPSMLALNDITESVIGDTPLVLLVAEDVDTIDWFFTDMFHKFLEDHESSVELIRSEWSLDKKNTFMRNWWGLIAKDFQIIFGDVVDGLLYLYSLGMPSGGLCDHIYVSRDKRGRILPRMDKMKTYEDDIVDLVKIMSDVIYQPRLQLGAKRESGYLGPELEHFLSFVRKDKLSSSVSAAWLLDQPYFWSSPKRVKFMRKLRKCIQKSSIDFNRLNNAVNRMMDQEFGANTLWFDYLQDPMLIKIWQGGKRGIAKKYTENGDIVRFFIAVCSHSNEKKVCGPKPIGDAVHEKIFRNHFPSIYTCLVNFIYECAQWNYFIHIQSSEALEWFLSSSDV